jgi:hypothetical protein
MGTRLPDDDGQPGAEGYLAVAYVVAVEDDDVHGDRRLLHGLRERTSARLRVLEQGGRVTAAAPELVDGGASGEIARRLREASATRANAIV